MSESQPEDDSAEHVRRHPEWIRRFDVVDAELRRVFEEVLAGIPADEGRRFPDLEVDEVAVTAEGANVRGGERWRMRVSPSQLKKRVQGDRAALRGLVAHELAHVFLRHAATNGRRNGSFDEIEADAQARRWVGGDVDAFRRRFGPPYGMEQNTSEA